MGSSWGLSHKPDNVDKYVILRIYVSPDKKNYIKYIILFSTNEACSNAMMSTSHGHQLKQGCTIDVLC